MSPVPKRSLSVMYWEVAGMPNRYVLFRRGWVQRLPLFVTYERPLGYLSAERRFISFDLYDTSACNRTVWAHGNWRLPQGSVQSTWYNPYYYKELPSPYGIFTVRPATKAAAATVVVAT